MTIPRSTALLFSMMLAIPALASAQPAGSIDAAAKGRFLGLQQALETGLQDRKSTRLNSSHSAKSRMPSSA